MANEDNKVVITAVALSPKWSKKESRQIGRDIADGKYDYSIDDLNTNANKNTLMAYKAGKSRSRWNKFVNWFGQTGLKASMTDAPAVMQASGYTHDGNGNVIYAPSEASDQLAKNLAVIGAAGLAAPTAPYWYPYSKPILKYATIAELGALGYNTLSNMANGVYSWTTEYKNPDLSKYKVIKGWKEFPTFMAADPETMSVEDAKNLWFNHSLYSTNPEAKDPDRDLSPEERSRFWDKLISENGLNPADSIRTYQNIYRSGKQAGENSVIIPTSWEQTKGILNSDNASILKKIFAIPTWLQGMPARVITGNIFESDDN